jgi:hypothetical protein
LVQLALFTAASGEKIDQSFWDCTENPSFL